MPRDKRKRRIDRLPMAAGQVQALRIRPDGLWLPVGRVHRNHVLYDWAVVVGGLLVDGTPGLRISGMYLEFENVVAPEDEVVAPSLSRGPDEGVAYYDSLADDADRDFLRVPLVAATLSASTTDSNAQVCEFFAQSSGVEGVHGKAFSDANNSKVFGGALVALVDEADRTRDVVLSRFYLDTAAQVLKTPTEQIGLDWRLILK